MRKCFSYLPSFNTTNDMCEHDVLLYRRTPLSPVSPPSPPLSFFPPFVAETVQGHQEAAGNQGPPGVPAAAGRRSKVEGQEIKLYAPPPLVEPCGASPGGWRGRRATGVYGEGNE